MYVCVCVCVCVCVYGPYEIKLKHYEIKYWLINLY